MISSWQILKLSDGITFEKSIKNIWLVYICLHRRSTLIHMEFDYSVNYYRHFVKIRVTMHSIAISICINLSVETFEIVEVVQVSKEFIKIVLACSVSKLFTAHIQSLAICVTVKISASLPQSLHLCYLWIISISHMQFENFGRKKNINK